MLWLTLLWRNGATEVKRLWRTGDEKALSKLSGVREVFGPFDAPTFPEAQANSRLILDAVGFPLDKHGLVQDKRG